MKKNISIFIASLAWIAVVMEYDLSVQYRVTSFFETTIHFFSYFTILTNTLVAIFFTLNVIKRKGKYLSILNKPGFLTAITVYITIVGLIYQIVLRPLFHPRGIQKIVTELLHSVIPIAVIVFWYLYEEKSLVKFRQIPRWLIYPLLYLVYIIILGKFTGFYPYPFVNVESIGLSKVLVNSAIITALFIVISAIFIKIGNFIKR